MTNTTEPQTATERDVVTISRDDALLAMDSVNYHYILMAKAAGTWRRKRPPQEDMAQGCDRRCTELEALYRRLDDAAKEATP